MRQNLLISRSGLLAKLSLLFAFLLMSATTWAATDEDYTEIAFGEDVTVVKGENFFKFTSTKAGNIVVATSDGTTNTVPAIYTDAAHSSKLTHDYYVGTAAMYANILEYTVEANTTYYLYVKRSGSTSFTFQVNEDPAVKLNSIKNGMTNTVTENSTIYLTGNYGKYNAKLSFAFNRVLDDWNTTATVTAGSHTEEVTIKSNDSYKYGKGNSIASVELYTILTNLINDGYLEDGGTFSITFSGIKARTTGKVYGEDGTATFTFKAVGTATVLKESKVPEKFLSFWNTDDEDGKIVLTFSNNLSTPKNTATISYGDSDASGSSDGSTTETEEEPGDAATNYTEITLPVAIDGKTATIDLTGAYRSFATLLPGATIKEPVAVNVAFPSLYDESGTKIETGQTGFSRFTYSIEGIEEVVTEGSFSPASGSLIDDYLNVSPVTFKLSHDLLKSYDGFKFTYKLKDGVERTCTVAASDVTKTVAEDGSVTYTFTAPDVAAVASTATVTLDNPVWYDAYGQVAPEYSATYNFTLQMAIFQPDALSGADMDDEESSATMESLKTRTTDEDGNEVSGDVVIVQVNAPSQIGVMRLMVKDVTAGEYVVTETSFTKVEDEEEPDGTYFMWENADPADYLFYTGHTYAVELYAAIDKESADDHLWVGSGSFYFTGTSAVPEYSEYTLVSVSPDPDDFTVESTDDDTYTVTFSGPVKIDSENSFVNVEDYTSNEAFGSITSTDGEEYSTTWTLKVAASTMEKVVDWLNLTVVAVDANGNRVKGNQGKDANTTYFLWEYVATMGVPDVTLSPVSGSTVDKIDVIYASYAEGIAASYYVNDSEIKVYDADGNEVAHVVDADFYIPEDKQEAYDNWEYTPVTFKLPLNNAIYAAGEYTIVIPATYFILGEEMYNMTSKTTKATYTVTGDIVPVEIGETGYATLYYSDKALTVPENVDAWTYSVSGSALVATESYPAGSVIPAGTGVVLRTQEPDTYEFCVSSEAGTATANNALKGTDEAVEVSAADGNKLYKLANGSKGMGFYLVSEDGLSFTNKAHKAYLEVSADADAKFFSVDGSTTGISSISSEAANNGNIYNLQGQKLNNMNRSGLYIVGGKKVVVK